MYAQLFHLIFFGLLMEYSRQAALTDEAKGMFQDFLNQCKLKEGASDDGIIRQLSGQDLITTPSKCVIACLHESFGLVKDGVVRPEVGLKLTKFAFDDDEQGLVTLRKIQKECASLDDEDRCQLAHKRFDCAKATSRKYGFAAPMW